MGFGFDNELPDLGTSLGGQFLDDLFGADDDQTSKNNSKNSFIDEIIKSVDDENSKQLFHQAEKTVTQDKAEQKTSKTTIANNDLEMQTDFGRTTEDKINNQSHHVYPIKVPTRLPVLHPQRNNAKRKSSVNDSTLAITPKPTKRVKYDVKCAELDQLRTENITLKQKNQELENLVNILANKNQKIIDTVVNDHACKINKLLCSHCKQVKMDNFEYEIVIAHKPRAQKSINPVVSDKIRSSEVIPKSSRPRRNRC